MLIFRVSDAILGLRELLNTYPILMPQLLTPLITATVRLMSDEVGEPLDIFRTLRTITPISGPNRSANIVIFLPLAYAARIYRETIDTTHHIRHP